VAARFWAAGTLGSWVQVQAVLDFTKSLVPEESLQNDISQGELLFPTNAVRGYVFERPKKYVK
jgi:hypothetical protein